MLAADLSDEHEAERLRAKVSEQADAVDVLVNNAGLGDSVLFHRAEWTRTRQILRNNILAVPSVPQHWCPAWWSAAGGVLNLRASTSQTRTGASRR